MEKTLQEQLNNIVQKFGEEKTFSLEALNSIADLRVQAEKLSNENKSLTTRIEDLEGFIKEKDKEIEELRQSKEKYRKREQDIADIETQKKLLDLEKILVNKNYWI